MSDIILGQGGMEILYVGEIHMNYTGMKIQKNILGQVGTQ